MKMPILLVILAFALIVAAIAWGADIAQRKDAADTKKAAEDREANPPSIEVLTLTDSAAAFPVYVIHDRATGVEWLAIGKPGKPGMVLLPRPTPAPPESVWTMPGDEKFRNTAARPAEHPEPKEMK